MPFDYGTRTRTLFGGISRRSAGSFFENSPLFVCVRVWNSLVGSGAACHSEVARAPFLSFDLIARRSRSCHSLYSQLDAAVVEPQVGRNYAAHQP